MEMDLQNVSNALGPDGSREPKFRLILVGDRSQIKAALRPAAERQAAQFFAPASLNVEVAAYPLTMTPIVVG